MAIPHGQLLTRTRSRRSGHPYPAGPQPISSGLVADLIAASKRSATLSRSSSKRQGSSTFASVPHELVRSRNRRGLRQPRGRSKGKALHTRGGTATCHTRISTTLTAQIHPLRPKHKHSTHPTTNSLEQFAPSPWSRVNLTARPVSGPLQHSAHKRVTAVDETGACETDFPDTAICAIRRSGSSSAGVSYGLGAARYRYRKFSRPHDTPLQTLPCYPLFLIPAILC